MLYIVADSYAALASKLEKANPVSATEKTVRDLIRGGYELPKVEFKSDLKVGIASDPLSLSKIARAKLAKLASSIANTDSDELDNCGYIILGAKRGEIIGGVEALAHDATSAKWVQQINAYLDPPMRLKVVSFKDSQKGWFGAIVIPASDPHERPHFINKGYCSDKLVLRKGECYVRIGDTTELARPADYHRMYMQKGVLVPSQDAVRVKNALEELRRPLNHEIGPAPEPQELESKLVEFVKANLYGEDDQLPYVLLQCLELANKIGSSRDVEWIMMELRGYPTEGQRDIDTRDEPYKSAQYRVIQPFFRVAFGHPLQIDEWPYRTSFYPKPVSQIIRTIRGAQSVGVNEVYSIISISDYEDLSKLATKIGSPPGGKLGLFIRLSELEGILDGLRARIATFLQQVG